MSKATDLVRTLSDSFGIMCRSGHMCSQPLVDSYHASQAIRVSGYIYNSRDDITEFFNALDSLVRDLF